MADSVTPSAATPSVTPAVVPAAVAPKAAAPVAEESFDVTVDGRVEKKSRKEIIEAYQMRQVSDKKRSEAEKSTAEYRKLFEVFKTDPVKFMSASGVDFDKLATGYLTKKAEDSMMDPKEKELRDTKAKMQEYEKWVNEQKTSQEQTKARAAVEQERGRIHAEIIEAIEANKELGLPVDEEMVIAIAQKMILQDKKQKPLNAKEALPAAYAHTQKWLQGMASKMDGPALINWLGKDVALKIRKHDLSELKKKRTTPEAKALVKPSVGKAPEKKYKTWSEFKADTLDKIV